MVDEVAGLQYGDSRACQSAVAALGEAYNGVFASTAVHNSDRNPFKKKSTKEILQAEQDLRALKKQRVSVEAPSSSRSLPKSGKNGTEQAQQSAPRATTMHNYFAPVTNNITNH